MMMLFSMMAILTTMFIFMKHPLSMGIILMMMTFLISMTSGMIIKSFWLSYILFIVMLGGMLVLFIYMASIASNEKFKTSTTMMITFSIMMTMATLLWMMSDKILMNKININFNNPLMENNQLMSLTKMFNGQSMMLTLMLVLYLLLTMIAVTYIVNVQEGPMRMKS